MSSVSAGLGTDSGIKSYASSNEAINDKYVGYLQTRDAWQAVLGGIIGIYGLIQQHELIQRQIAVMERNQSMQEQYLTLAQRHYDEIAVPTWTRQKDLYDRYVSAFAGYEVEYLADAFRLKEYAPEYDAQMGRSIALIQEQFDRAAQQRRRAVGKYASGRCCDDALRFSIARTLGVTDAINHGYRYEEQKKRELDAWYWARRTDGARITNDMANRVVSGINGGLAGATNALNALGGAYRQAGEAAAGVANAYGAMSAFYGGIASMGFRMAGLASGQANASGRSGISPFGGGAGSIGIDNIDQNTSSNVGGGIMSFGAYNGLSSPTYNNTAGGAGGGM